MWWTFLDEKVLDILLPPNPFNFIEAARIILSDAQWFAVVPRNQTGKMIRIPNASRQQEVLLFAKHKSVYRK